MDAPRFDCLTGPEEEVVHAFFRTIPPTQCLAVRISQGEYVLRVGHGAHRQEVRHRDLFQALGLALRVHDALTLPTATAQEAA